MIVAFACLDTEELFINGKNRKFQAIAKVAKRKLDQLHVAGALADLRIPPGNRLEALCDNRAGQYSIRVNDQWRVCFVWDASNNNASHVEIVDYH